MENLKVGEIYHITDNEYPGKEIIYKHERMSDEVRGFGYYISNMNTGNFQFQKSAPYLQGRNIKKATELKSEWLKYCIKDNTYVSYHNFMMDYKHKLTGRKVRALIDSPYAGTVPKGEIGVIISSSGYIYVDFPSQQGYLLNGAIDESKIELLPPDLTHLYEVGKWYKFKGEDTYAKFSDISRCGEYFYFSECIIEGKYEKVRGDWYTNHCKDIASNSEIQKFITSIKEMKKFPIGPIGIKDIRNGRVYSNFTSTIKNVKHGNCELADNPDIRIIGYEDDLYVVRWTDNVGREVIQGFKEEDLVEAKNPEKLVFGKFSIGDIVVSMRDVIGYRSKGDLFVVLPNSSKNTLWYRMHVNNDEINSTSPDQWRLATDDEKKLYENGIRNIKAVSEEIVFRIKDHKKEQKDNRLIQLKIRDKSVTTTTQQRVKLKIIKPSLITIKN